jgi:uncharacterized membrane protein YkgB
MPNTKLSSPATAVVTQRMQRDVVALRMSVGLVVLLFGALKFFPGASPAEALVMRTVDALTLGLISGTGAVVATAVVETVIGLSLVTGIALRAGVLLLFPAIAGMMSPLLLFPADMFPHGLPTMEAQYVLKDVIIAAAALVIAKRALKRDIPLAGRLRALG